MAELLGLLFLLGVPLPESLLLRLAGELEGSSRIEAATKVRDEGQQQMPPDVSDYRYLTSPRSPRLARWNLVLEPMLPCHSTMKPFT